MSSNANRKPIGINTELHARLVAEADARTLGPMRLAELLIERGLDLLPPVDKYGAPDPAAMLAELRRTLMAGPAGDDRIIVDTLNTLDELLAPRPA